MLAKKVKSTNILLQMNILLKIFIIIKKYLAAFAILIKTPMVIF